MAPIRFPSRWHLTLSDINLMIFIILSDDIVIDVNMINNSKCDGQQPVDHLIIYQQYVNKEL